MHWRASIPIAQPIDMHLCAAARHRNDAPQIHCSLIHTVCKRHVGLVCIPRRQHIRTLRGLVVRHHLWPGTCCRSAFKEPQNASHDASSAPSRARTRASRPAPAGNPDVRSGRCRDGPLCRRPMLARAVAARQSSAAPLHNNTLHIRPFFHDPHTHRRGGTNVTRTRPQVPRGSSTRGAMQRRCPYA